MFISRKCSGSCCSFAMSQGRCWRRCSGRCSSLVCLLCQGFGSLSAGRCSASLCLTGCVGELWSAFGVFEARKALVHRVWSQVGLERHGVHGGWLAAQCCLGCFGSSTGSALLCWTDSIWKSWCAETQTGWFWIDSSSHSLPQHPCRTWDTIVRYFD